MPNGPPADHRWERGARIAAVIGAVAGYVGGGLFMAATMGAWSEALKRYFYGLQGGGGEGAYWGEPVSYALFLFVSPNAGTMGGALVGAAAAVVLIRAVASAGGWWRFVHKRWAPLVLAWLVVIGLAGWFAHVQWLAARDDVARYRQATQPSRVVVAAPGAREAARTYDRGCTAGDARACYNAGAIHENGQGVPTDAPRALAYYREGCAGRYAGACRGAGSLAYRGAPGVTKDLVEARATLATACRLRDGWACFQVGFMHERAEGGTRDFAQAAGFYREACALAYGMGCQYLGDAYMHGEGVARDDGRGTALYRQAAQLLEQECNHGEAYSCYALGVMFRSGQGTAADAPRARQLIERACAGGSKEACAAR